MKLKAQADKMLVIACHCLHCVYRSKLNQVPVFQLWWMFITNSLDHVFAACFFICQPFWSFDCAWSFPVKRPRFNTWLVVKLQRGGASDYASKTLICFLYGHIGYSQLDYFHDLNEIKILLVESSTQKKHNCVKTYLGLCLEVTGVSLCTMTQYCID